MAGSIADNALVCKKFKFIPPATPAQLVDCTNFTLDFVERKFINVGFNPANYFETTVQILTSSRHVNITSDIFTRIFGLMGHILSFILERPVKYKRITFLDTETITLSSMIYRGESVLVIESKIHSGCRILLNRGNLMTLQHLEWAVYESIVRKNTINRPIVLRQFEQMVKYFKNEIKNVENVEEIATTIRNIHDDLISNNLPKDTQSYVSQLKMCAAMQLAKLCVMKPENDSPEVNIGYDISFTTTPSFSPTPMSQDNPHAGDVNDGPSYFDLQYQNSSIP